MWEYGFGSQGSLQASPLTMQMRSTVKDYYIAGGIKSIFDIKRAKHFGASGVLVSTMIHQNKITKYMIQKEKTSSKNRAG